MSKMVIVADLEKKEHGLYMYKCELTHTYAHASVVHTQM